MPYPICVRCNKEMRPKKNGEFVLEEADFGPYKIWNGDVHQCPVCGFKVVVGFGNGPMANHFDEHFKDYLPMCKVKFK